MNAAADDARGEDGEHGRVNDRLLDRGCTRDGLCGQKPTLEQKSLSSADAPQMPMHTDCNSVHKRAEDTVKAVVRAVGGNAAKQK